MSSPPEHIPPTELWSELTKMPRPHRVVSFPRKNKSTGEPVGEVILMVLSQGEAIEAAAQAEKYTRATLKAALDENVRKDEQSAGYDDIYNNASVDEVLFRATRRGDDVNAIFFPSAASIRQKLTQDEVACLFREYLIVKAELGPIVAEMGEGEMKSWVRTLVEGGSAYPLARLSSDGLNALVMLMASQLASLWTDTSLPGWLPVRSPMTPAEQLLQDVLLARPPADSTPTETSSSSPLDDSKPEE